MPGQSWPGAAASFVGMWTVMMVAMMLPSLVPVLWRYRQEVGRSGGTRLARPTALVGIGYFSVWTVLGAAVYPPGVALAAIVTRQPGLARFEPIVAAVVVLISGALQLTAWKARRLACWREAPWHGGAVPVAAGAAWRCGLRLGLQCAYSCAGPMADLLVVGLKDQRAMAVVTAALTAERLARAGERVARVTGMAAVGGAGVFLIVQGARFDHSSAARVHAGHAAQWTARRLQRTSGFAGDDIGPTMSGITERERLMEPPPLFDAKMRQCGSKIGVVLRCGAFRFVEEDDLRGEVGNARRRREGRRQRQTNATIAAEVPPLPLLIVVVQQELEMVSVWPRRVDFMHRRLHVFLHQPLGKSTCQDLLGPARRQSRSQVPVVAA